MAGNIRLGRDHNKRLLRMSEISLQLDTYDDVFSDFDPRPFSQRALSVDFLDEAKRASREMRESIELKFLIPEKARNLRDEQMIKKRLKEHFQKHHRMLHKERSGIMRQGALFVIAGIILMFLAAYVLFTYAETSLATAFLVVFLEPAGWFLFWEGLDLVIFEPKSKKPNLEFYGKMAKCQVEFVSY